MDRGRKGNSNREPSNQRSWSVGSDWSRSVGRNWGMTVNRLVDVLNVGDVAGVSIGDVVGNNLSTTVGQVDAVFAVGRVSVASLVVPEVGATVVGVALNSVTKFIDWRSVWVDWSLAISGNRGVCRRGREGSIGSGGIGGWSVRSRGRAIRSGSKGNSVDDRWA